SAVCPGTNQVEGIFHSRSMSSSRRAPTTPNSPREIALGEVAWKLPIQTEIASKSKVRQTVTFFALAFFVIGEFPLLARSRGHLYCDRIASVQRPRPCDSRTRKAAGWPAGGAACQAFGPLYTLSERGGALSRCARELASCHCPLATSIQN